MRKLIAGLVAFAVIVTPDHQAAQSQTPAEWKVGLATAKITPEVPVFTAGYASRNKPFEKVEHDLWAKALVLEDKVGQRAVIVTSDILGFPASVAEPICELVRVKTGLKREQILLNSAHTHTGPVVGLEQARVSAGNIPPEHAERTVAYTQTLIEKVADCIVRANEQLVPANLSWGLGLQNFVMNRREHTPTGVILGVNPSGPADRSVPTLRVDDPSGKLLAVLFQAACHNTTLGPSNYEICGDYAGFAQYHVQEKLPGVQAMFMLGCAGDSNPIPRTGMDDARMHGAALGTEVCRVLGTRLKPVRGPLKVAFDRAAPPLQPLTREELDRRKDTRGLFGDLAKRMLESLDKGEQLPTSYRAPLAVLQFGEDLTLVGLSGEVVVDYVYLLQKALGPLNLWVAAYCNDVFGYLPSARVLDEGGYETRGLYSGALGFFTPAVQDVMVAKVRELAAKAGRTVPK